MCFQLNRAARVPDVAEERVPAFFVIGAAIGASERAEISLGLTHCVVRFRNLPQPHAR